MQYRLTFAAVVPLTKKDHTKTWREIIREHARLPVDFKIVHYDPARDTVDYTATLSFKAEPHAVHQVVRTIPVPVEYWDVHDEKGNIIISK